MNCRIALLALALATGLASGCASQSGKTFAQLNRDHPDFKSEECQQAIRDTEIHDELKLLRTIASPVVTFLSGGLLLPAVLAGNVSLDAADHIDASRMDEHCGGEGQSSEQIASSVATNAAISVAGSVVSSAVAPGILGAAANGGTPTTTR